MAKTKTKSKSKKSKKAQKAVKSYDDFARLVGQSAKAKDTEDNEIKEVTVVELGEYDKNGVPHTAVCQLRRAVTRFVVKPQDIELIEGNGFGSGF
jgi:hypothetical protein